MPPEISGGIFYGKQAGTEASLFAESDSKGRRTPLPAACPPFFIPIYSMPRTAKRRQFFRDTLEKKRQICYFITRVCKDKNLDLIR